MFLCITYSITDTTRGSLLICNQQSSGGTFSEENTGQNMDKELRNTQTTATVNRPPLEKNPTAELGIEPRTY